jgi:glycosyltransferase involved in cell wall biosynthesis
MDLSILIPTIPSRAGMLQELLESLTKQIKGKEVEILVNSEDLSIGEKRNKLLEQAKGKYVCFIDDDDEVSSRYIDLIFEGIIRDVDCCSLRGVITWNGENHEIFEHSIRYSKYHTTNNYVKYERYPNHLNAIKATIAKQFKFPEINYGEDTEWATQVHKSGLIKTEYYIHDTIYHYKFIPNK